MAQHATPFNALAGGSNGLRQFYKSATAKLAQNPEYHQMMDYEHPLHSGPNNNWQTVKRHISKKALIEF